MFRPKLAFVGRQYHQKTKSDQFMIDLLRSFCEVRIFRREQYSPKGLVRHIRDFAPTYVFYWCLPPSVKEHLFRLKCRKHIWAPMWDGFKELPRRKEKVFSFFGVKVICFSKILHDYFSRIGLSTRHVRYFPEPHLPFEGKKKGPYTVFLWQREEKISPENIVRLIGSEQIEKIIYKSETGEEPPRLPFPVERLPDWVSREVYLEKMKEADFYIAPRSAEGIGFGFLEPMSFGKVVFAYDNATMNEYIVPGKNGYLFDDRFLLEEPLRSPAELLPYMKKYAESYRHEWSEAVSTVRSFVEG